MKTVNSDEWSIPPWKMFSSISKHSLSNSTFIGFSYFAQTVDWAMISKTDFIYFANGIGESSVKNSLEKFICAGKNPIAWILITFCESWARQTLAESPKGNWILSETECNFFNQRNDETGFLSRRNAIRVHCHARCEAILMNCVH